MGNAIFNKGLKSFWKAAMQGLVEIKQDCGMSMV